MADVNWMRASANVRLANLYMKTGKGELASNHLDAAWQAFSRMGIRVRGITTKHDLIGYIQQGGQEREMVVIKGVNGNYCHNSVLPPTTAQGDLLSGRCWGP
jgi:hypothetical protein